MKGFRSYDWLFVLLLCCCSGVWHATWAEYTVEPLRIEATAPIGRDIATTSIRVRNTGSDPIRLKAYVSNWSLDEGGGLQISDEPLPQGIAEQVRFNPKEFEIAPNDSQVVRLAISLPPEATVGEYRGMLFFEDLKPQSQRLALPQGYGASVQIKQRLGIAMYVYKGSPVSSPKLATFQCNLENGKLMSRIQLENPGTKHLRLSGSILFSQEDSSGHWKPFREVPVNDLRDIIVLPQTARTLQQLLAPTPEGGSFPPGHYSAELHLAPPVGEKQEPLTATTTLIWPDILNSQAVEHVSH